MKIFILLSILLSVDIALSKQKTNLNPSSSLRETILTYSQFSRLPAQQKLTYVKYISALITTLELSQGESGSADENYVFSAPSVNDRWMWWRLFSKTVPEANGKSLAEKSPPLNPFNQDLDEVVDQFYKNSLNAAKSLEQTTDQLNAETARKEQLSAQQTQEEGTVRKYTSEIATLEKELEKFKNEKNDQLRLIQGSTNNGSREAFESASGKVTNTETSLANARLELAKAIDKKDMGLVNIATNEKQIAALKEKHEKQTKEKYNPPMRDSSVAEDILKPKPENWSLSEIEKKLADEKMKTTPPPKKYEA